jgi:hypothetical protein
MQYYTAVNTGYGFITHEDNERSYIEEFPGQLYITENNQIWADRVGAIAKTKAEAQAICDAAIDEGIIAYQNCISGSQPGLCGPVPTYIILP